MNFNQCKSQIEKYWERYHIHKPDGADNLLFQDLKDCRSPFTRQAYVDMLDMLLKEFERFLSIDKPFGVYHYRLEINSKYTLELSFGIMTSPLSFSIHSRINNRYELDSEETKNEWSRMIAYVKERGFDVSNYGKYNKYISFHNKEEHEKTWDWVWHELLRQYENLIETIKTL